MTADQVERRPGDASPHGSGGSPDPVSLISDPKLMQQWLSSLNEIAAARASSSAADATVSLGAAMAAFVLDGVGGLRALHGAEEGGFRLPADKVAEESRRIRRLLTAQVTDEERLKSLPAAARLAVMALVLLAAESGVWGSPLGEDGWLRVVSKILEDLGQAEIPDSLSTRAASWAALGIYLMHQHRPTTGRPAEAGWYDDAADAVAYLLADADEELIAAYAEPFTNANGYPVDPEAVMHVIGVIVQGDPLGEAIDILGRNRPAWRVDKHNARLLHVDVDSRSTMLPATEVLAAIPGDGMAAAWATGSTDAWTIAIRDAGTLIRVDKDARGQITWHHFKLGPLTSPVGIARDPGQASRARIPHGALSLHFDEAIKALIAIGINLSADPPSDCPD